MKTKKKKDLEERKIVFSKGLEFYNNLLNIYKTKYDHTTKTIKKKVTVQNRPEQLFIGLCLHEDDLSHKALLEFDKKVKLEPEETISGKAKLIFGKRKK